MMFITFFHPIMNTGAVFMEDKSFNEIMQDITAGLTGDNEKDVSWLLSQIETYKNHEMGKEIIRACSRMLFEKLPEDKRKELEQDMENRFSGVDAVLEEVRFNIYKKEYGKALKMTEDLVLRYETMNLFQDDAVSEYRHFDESFEQVLYVFRNKPQKTIRRAEVPYTEIYLLYGSLLVELKRYQDAETALLKGLRWNPVSFRLLAEYSEAVKMTGGTEKFFELSKEMLKNAFRMPDVARAYRNIAWYFTEKKLYREAMGCLLLSMEFQKDSPQAQSELYYIQTETNGTVSRPSFEEFKTTAEQYGFSVGPDRDVIGLSYNYGKHFFENHEQEAARYYLTIAYDLTGILQIKDMLDKLPKLS